MVLRSGDSEGAHPLDKLYWSTLERQFVLRVTQTRFCDVMTVMFALNGLLSLVSLSAHFGQTVREIIKPLGSLLDGTHDEGKPIRPHHTSFRDLLPDERCSSSIHIQTIPHHGLSLGQALISCIRNMLRFNICDLQMSRTPTL